MIVIRQDDLAGEATRGLVALHLAEMHAFSPPGHVFALDSSGLLAPDVTVWTAWIGGDIAGMAALRQLPGIGELKSMRTHPRHLRKGVAAALLEHIIGEARARGLERVSLEPALALYRKRGFSEGEPFGSYVRSDFNRFLHLSLAGSAL